MKRFACSACDKFFEAEGASECPHCHAADPVEFEGPAVLEETEPEKEPEPEKEKRVATLPSEETVLKFELLLAAGDTGQISLIRGFKHGTGEEVTMLAIITPGSQVPILPIAVMIEGNPLEQYDPPDEILDDTPRIIRPH